MNTKGQLQRAYDAAIANMSRARVATNWTEEEIDLASAALCDASLALQRENPIWGTAYIKCMRLEQYIAS